MTVFQIFIAMVLYAIKILKAQTTSKFTHTHKNENKCTQISEDFYECIPGFNFEPNISYKNATCIYHIYKVKGPQTSSTFTKKKNTAVHRHLKIRILSLELNTSGTVDATTFYEET